MRVALTFDTEPSPAGQPADAARRILDALAERGAVATFFVQGEWAEQHPDLAARLGAEGHRVGNHTYSHALPGAIGAEELRAEIAHAEQVLERLTGQNPRPYFRCPQNSGAFDPEVLERIAAQGYRQVGWTFDSFDWHEKCTPEQLSHSVVESVSVHGDGAVVLLHSWPGATAEALPTILSELIERGAEFVTLDEFDADALPAATVMPAGPPLPGHDLGASTLWGIAAKIVTFAANFIIGIIIARALGPEGKGAYAFVLQVVAVLAVVLGLGLTTANVRFVASREVSAKAATANSLWLAAATGIFALGVCLLVLAGPLAPDPPYSLAMALTASALFVFTVLFAWLGAVAAGLSGLRPRSVAGIVAVLAVLGGLIALWLAGGLTPLRAVALGVAGQAIAVGVVLLQERGRMLAFRPSVRSLKSMVSYSARSYVVELVGYLHLRLDILLLGWLVGAAGVGVYSVAVSFAEIARYVPIVIGAAMFARASQLSAEEAVRVSARISRLTAAIVLTTAAIFAVLGPLLIPLLFGERFSGAVLPLLVLLPGVVFMSVAEVPGSYLFSRGVIYWKSAAVIVVLNVILNLIAVPRIGVLGAALASTVTYALFMSVILWLMRRESGVRYRELLVPTRDDLRAASAAVRRYTRSR
jgi:peptidoglycan/xylan/chitin deacetylase (PgdA/CDA1 family)/O-antigen/teichoic acid export membrane protein